MAPSAHWAAGHCRPEAGKLLPAASLNLIRIKTACARGEYGSPCHESLPPPAHPPVDPRDRGAAVVAIRTGCAYPGLRWLDRDSGCGHKLACHACGPGRNHVRLTLPERSEQRHRLRPGPCCPAAGACNTAVRSQRLQHGSRIWGRCARAARLEPTHITSSEHSVDLSHLDAAGA